MFILGRVTRVRFRVTVKENFGHRDRLIFDNAHKDFGVSVIQAMPNYCETYVY